MSDFGNFAIPSTFKELPAAAAELLATMRRTRTTDIKMTMRAGPGSTPLHAYSRPKYLSIQELDASVAPRIRKHAEKHSKEYLWKFYKTDPLELKKLDITWEFFDVMIDGELCHVTIGKDFLDVQNLYDALNDQ